LEDGRCEPVVAELRRSAPRARLVLMTGHASHQECADLASDRYPHDFVAKPLHRAFLHARLIVIEEKVRKQATDRFLNLALADGMAEATASLRKGALDRLLQDARGNVSEAARRVRMNRTHIHKLLTERKDAQAVAFVAVPNGVDSASASRSQIAATAAHDGGCSRNGFARKSGA